MGTIWTLEHAVARNQIYWIRGVTTARVEVPIKQWIGASVPRLICDGGACVGMGDIEREDRRDVGDAQTEEDEDGRSNFEEAHIAGSCS